MSAFMINGKTRSVPFNILSSVYIHILNLLMYIYFFIAKQFNCSAAFHFTNGILETLGSIIVKKHHTNDKNDKQS